MDVLHPTNFFQKVCEVIFFGEARQLGDIVQSDINQTFCAGLTQQSKEGGSGFFREAKGIYFQRMPSRWLALAWGFSTI